MKDKCCDVPKVTCSFCDADVDSVRWLIKKRGVYICDQCIEICAKIIDLAEKGELPKEKIFEKEEDSE